jgi:hypothetical protein
MSALKDLPFDQYSRQKIVANLINNLRNREERFTILDVGGYKGKTREFFPKDKVTILDVFDVKEEDYIKGDGTKLNLKNDSSDFVVSFDVLEHIPKLHRANFIKECARVAKNGFFLCCPFENGTGVATEAEKNLNAIYSDLQGREHDWLKEHIENGLPDTTTIEATLTKNNLSFTKMFSNKIDNWVALQTAFFLSDALEVVSIEAGKLNHYYNQNLKTMERGSNSNNAYRVIYFISQNKVMINKVEKSFASWLKDASKKEGSIGTKLPKSLSEIIKTKLAAENEILRDQLREMTERTELLRKELEAIRNSTSWKVTKPLRTASRIKRGSK